MAERQRRPLSQEQIEQLIKRVDGKMEELKASPFPRDHDKSAVANNILKLVIVRTALDAVLHGGAITLLLDPDGIHTARVIRFKPDKTIEERIIEHRVIEHRPVE